MPTTQDLVNRGNNLFPIAIVGAIAAGSVPEIPGEGFPRGALDEIVMVIIAAAAVYWYMRRRYTRSLVPAMALAGVLVMKIVALLIEDADDKGDDIGIALVMVVSIVTWVVIYMRTKAAVTAS